ncbi:MAG: lipopolysaccharide biosynthesis protein [Chloroflexi bacterium]|nr:lipopolysaccharide biosynthesis protein [Chloroflexota bacterium]
MLRVAGLKAGHDPADRPVPAERERTVWRRFGKNFSLGFGGSALSSLIGVGRTAVMTKVLTVADFGRVLIVLNLAQFARVAISVRVNDMLYRFMPEFKEQNDRAALQGLLILALLLSLATGLIVAGGMVALGPWIAQTFYRDANLVGLFGIYGVGALFLSLQEFCGTILRLEDEFPWVIAPQLLGNLVRLVLLATYLTLVHPYRLEWVVAIFALGLVVDEVPAMWRALVLIGPYLKGWTLRSARDGLQRHWGDIGSTLSQTTLSGYLQLTSNPGDQFVLGLLSTPEEVAVYGLAQQLVRPVRTLLRRNVQLAVSPETVSLWAQQRYRQLERMVWRLLVIGGLIGGLALIVLMPLARWGVVWVGKPKYLHSLPVFYVVSAETVLSVVLIAFYSIGLCMGLIKRRNLVLLASAVALGLVALTGMTAFKMASVQLGGTLLMALFFDLPVMQRLHGLAQKPRPQQRAEESATEGSALARGEGG